MDKAARAREAKALMNNTTLTAALDAIERDAIEHMLSADTEEARLNGSLRANAVRSLRKKLEIWSMDAPKPALEVV